MSKSFTPYDVQKIRLEKLMSNIDKPIEIPKRVEEKKFPDAPDFVRNVMGSSAGAGSGEFHVYRHLRRKEYARLRYIEAQSKKEKMDEEYHKRIEENKAAAEERTLKKRAKRQKQKLRKKLKKGNDGKEKSKDEESDEKGSENEDSEPAANEDGQNKGSDDKKEESSSNSN